MAYENAVPDRIVAGDSAAWTRSLTDYPASGGWSLKYTLVGPTSVYTIDATADGDDFAVSVAANASAEWVPGSYSLQEYVSNAAGERHTIGITRFAVAANLAATSAGGADTRSHAQKVLDSINAWLESRAPVAGSVQVNGRNISWYPIADLLVLRDRYRREVALEADGGLRRGHPVYVSL